jgi:hypothetical protein
VVKVSGGDGAQKKVQRHREVMARAPRHWAWVPWWWCICPVLGTMSDWVGTVSVGTVVSG